MRSFVLVLALALALPLVAALNVTAVTSGSSLLSVAAALPSPVCEGECVIEASSAPGYVSPVVVMSSGSSVRWLSTDIGHVQTDVGVGNMGAACFFVASEQDELSPPVRFDVAEGALFATLGSETNECGRAVGDEGAGFLLNYFCAIHPTMRGALVVTS